MRRGDRAAIERLRKENDALVARQRDEQLRKLTDAPGASINPKIVELYHSFVNAPATTESVEQAQARYQDIWRKLGAEMGQLPTADGGPSPSDNRFSTTSGSVTREELTLNFNWMMFQSPVDGPATLVKRLDAQGCTDFRYEFDSGAFAGEYAD